MRATATRTTNCASVSRCLPTLNREYPGNTPGTSSRKHEEPAMSTTPHDIFQRSAAPVTIDENLCIADKGCTVCVDVCPLDLLAIDVSKGKAYMKFDECWYCMPCEKDCPT